MSGVRTDKGTIHARLVVGADGRHSTVAEAVGAARMGAPGAATPWVNAVLREISASPAATRAFAQVLNHDIPPSKL